MALLGGASFGPRSAADRIAARADAAHDVVANLPAEDCVSDDLAVAPAPWLSHGVVGPLKAGSPEDPRRLSLDTRDVVEGSANSDERDTADETGCEMSPQLLFGVPRPTQMMSGSS